MLLRPSSWTLFIRCWFWSHLTLCLFWIVITGRRIRVRFPLILATKIHFLRYIAKILVWIISTCVRILINDGAFFCSLDKSFIRLHCYMFLSWSWLVVTWARILISFKLILASKINFIEITSKRFLIIMCAWTKMSFLLLLPYLSHLAETDHFSWFALFWPFWCSWAIRLLRLSTFSVSNVIIHLFHHIFWHI